MNLCVLMGRLTAAPELKKTNSGLSVASFAIAVDRDFKGKDGEKQTDFINCVAWRNTAEFICRYFAKGQMIAVEGNIQTRKYTDKNGNDRTATEVLVNQAHFTGEKRGNTGDSGTAPESAGYPADASFADVEYEDDILPF